MHSAISFSPRFGHEIVLDWSLPEGAIGVWDGDVCKTSVSPDMYVEMLMKVDGGKFKSEPNNAVFEHFGFTDEAVKVCAAYAKATVHRKINRVFDMVSYRFKDEPWPKWMIDAGVDKIMPKYKIKTPCELPSVSDVSMHLGDDIRRYRDSMVQSLEIARAIIGIPPERLGCAYKKGARV